MLLQPRPAKVKQPHDGKVLEKPRKTASLEQPHPVDTDIVRSDLTRGTEFSCRALQRFSRIRSCSRAMKNRFRLRWSSPDVGSFSLANNWNHYLRARRIDTLAHLGRGIRRGANSGAARFRPQNAASPSSRPTPSFETTDDGLVFPFMLRTTVGAMPPPQLRRS
jgi:hypothetical protein